MRKLLVAVVALALPAVGLAAIPAHAAAPAHAAGTLNWWGWPHVKSQGYGPVRAVAPGVTEQSYAVNTSKFALNGWLVRVDLANPAVRLEAVAARNHEAAGGQALTVQARRVGARVAVNTDFFRIWTDKSTLNEEIVNGGLRESQWYQGTPGAPYSQLMVTGRDKVSFGYAHFSGRLTFIRFRRLRAGGRTRIQVQRRRIRIAGVNTTETDLTPDSSLGDPYAAGAVVITQSYGQAITRRLVEVSLRPTRHGYVVRWVRRRTRVTPPPRGFLDLVADRGPGNWLAHFVRHGALVQLQENTGGYSQVVGGGPLMVAGGRIADTIGDDQPPEAKTGAMLDRTGRWLTFVCFEGDSGGWGLTRHEFAGWMLAHGGYSGMMFDDGGSAELAVRPGARYHILNPLENNWQRPVAESLAVLG